MSRTGRGNLACQAPDSVVDTKCNIRVMSPASAKNVRNAVLREILDIDSSVSYNGSRRGILRRMWKAWLQFVVCSSPTLHACTSTLLKAVKR